MSYLPICALLLAGAFGIAGCGPSEIRWTEEVKLHDGRVIQLKRRTELTASGFPVQKRGFYIYHEFCYPPLGIHWLSKPEYSPEVFDIVKGRAYSKVSLGTDCTRCMLHDYPETNAIYFAWDRGGWQKIAYEEYPAALLRLNLLMTPKGREPSEDARGLVTLAEKERRDPSVLYSLKVMGARGLNELPERRGACTKCKTVQIQTDQGAEVFLPSSAKPCDWKESL